MYGAISNALYYYYYYYIPVADPECARGGGVSHILAEKRGVSFTLFKKMHENSIFSPITGGGGVRRVRPMLDPPLYTDNYSVHKYYYPVYTMVGVNYKCN